MTRGQVIEKIEQMGYIVTYNGGLFVAAKNSITITAKTPLGLLKKINNNLTHEN